jgi:small GTP-binding protein
MEREEWKVIMLGDPLVGKTSIRRSYLGQDNKTTLYQMTMGTEFSIKKLPNGTLKIWDVGGQDGFSTIRKSAYEDTCGAIIVFDVSRKETFENIQLWLDELRAHVDYEVPVLLVANKIDLRGEIECMEEQETLKELMFLTNIKELNYIESSALTGLNIDKIFEQLLTLMKMVKNKQMT